MPDKDSLNLSASSPDDYMFVSKKNWERKEKIQNGDVDTLTRLVGRPGPVTGIVLSLVDMASTFCIRILLILLQITSIAFGWVNNLIFGNLKGIIPNEIKKGAVVSLKWFRYAMTILMPPAGVFLSKGIYGWFNIIVCIVITYINFIAGIIYAFVITMRNRYADQYEDNAYISAIKAYPLSESTADLNALFSTIGFTLIILGSIGFMLHFF